MPRYSFRCPNGDAFEAYAPFDDVWAICPQHGVGGIRDYAADFASQSTVCDDHIRRAYNGSAIDHALATQGRPLDPLAPKDKFEARHVEKATGRVYIGDDISKLRPISQKAILNGERQSGQARPRL